MGITRKKKHIGFYVTFRKLETQILDFLTEHEADMVADYRPNSEQWRQQLSKALALALFASNKNR